MDEAVDQVFVTVKHAVVGVFPVAWQPLLSAVLSVVPLLVAGWQENRFMHEDEPC